MKTWQYTRRPTTIKNLPFFTYFVTDGKESQLVPDVESALDELPNIDVVAEDYRGLCVCVSDHGNVSLLMRFKNGNTREMWGCV